MSRYVLVGGPADGTTVGLAAGKVPDQVTSPRWDGHYFHDRTGCDETHLFRWLPCSCGAGTAAGQRKGHLCVCENAPD